MKETIGLLHPGEMGSALGRGLLGAGHRVVTSVTGRGARTVARASQFENLATLAAVVAQAEVIVSVVDPLGALALAEDVAKVAQGRRLVYVDANALSHGDMLRVAAVLEGAGVQCVDGCIFGSSTRFVDCKMFFAGAGAGDMAELFRPVVASQVLGAEVGVASRFKVTYSTLVKGLAALFFEVGASAETQRLLEPLLAAFDELPSVGELLRVIVPTYINHAPRRARELAAAADEFQALGIEPRMAGAASSTIERIAGADLSALDAGSRTLEDTIKALVQAGVLKTLA